MPRKQTPRAQYTVAQAARELGVSASLVRKLITRGDLRAVAITTRLYLIDAAALDTVRVRPPPGRPRAVPAAG
jgi:excisionase family DNA binding protein